jgi:hypothetical protein
VAAPAGQWNTAARGTVRAHERGAAPARAST